MIIKSLQFSPKYTVRVGEERSHEIEKRTDTFVWDWAQQQNSTEGTEESSFHWATWLLCGQESKRNFLVSVPWDLIWNIRKTILYAYVFIYA